MRYFNISASRELTVADIAALLRGYARSRGHRTLLHTDAVLYPGFSGGALVNVDGRLLGMTNLLYGHGRGVAIGAPVVKQVVNLPVGEQAQSLPKSQYVLNSAHHGLAIDAPGTQLCVAGTMDDYVALVNIANPTDQKLFRLRHVGDRPYWATNAQGNAQCWVSIAGDDRVNVYDYAKRKQVGSIPVGDHPQRVRPGTVAADAVRTWGRP